MTKITIALKERHGSGMSGCVCGWSSIEPNLCHEVLYPPSISYFSYKVKYIQKLVVE